MPQQIWATDSYGGYMYSLNLSKKLRMALQPMTKFRQFCDVKDAAHQGLSKGDTFHWNVFTDVSTQGTTLVETNTMPETNFTITQGTMTITEAGNSVPYTGKLDNLSEQPVTEIINKVLKNDATKFFDAAAETEFAKTQLAVAGTATDSLDLYTNGTATGTGLALNTFHVAAIVDTMKERNIPAYANGDYYAISHPTTFTTLQSNLDTIHQYTPSGLNFIMNGEMGRYHGVRFIEQTNIAKSNSGSGWTNTSWAYFFGEDTVAEAIAVSEEMRGKIPTDFGRSKGIAWYYLGGFANVHDSAATYSALANTRIIRWDATV